MRDKEDFIETMTAIVNFDIFYLAELQFKKKNLFDFDYDKRSTMHLAVSMLNNEIFD